MKCPKCDYNNLEHSEFCQDCGYRFQQITQGERTRKQALMAGMEREIDDIIFTPKTKSNRTVAILVIMGFIGFLVLLVFIAASTSSDNTTTETPATTETTDITTVDLTCLVLSEEAMTGNTTYIPNPTYEATLYNGCSYPVTNVMLRVNFYKNGATTTDEMPLDTQYVTATELLGAGDSTRVKGTIETNADTSGEFMYSVTVYTAERL